MTGPFALAAALAAMPVHAAAEPRPPAVPLQPMTPDEVLEAGAAGAGCSWALPGERRSRLAMADNRAAVRVGGRVVQLRPLPGAAELAPFTFDAWTGGGMTVRVRQGRPARTRGSAVIRPATVDVRGTTRPRSYAGELTCGS